MSPGEPRTSVRGCSERLPSTPEPQTSPRRARTSVRGYSERHLETGNRGSAKATLVARPVDRYTSAIGQGPGKTPSVSPGNLPRLRRPERESFGATRGATREHPGPTHPSNTTRTLIHGATNAFMHSSISVQNNYPTSRSLDTVQSLGRGGLALSAVKSDNGILTQR
jgi:hypothetical protein